MAEAEDGAVAAVTAEEGLREIERLALEHRADLSDAARCELIARAEPALTRRALGACPATHVSALRRRILLAAWERGAVECP